MKTSLIDKLLSEQISVDRFSVKQVLILYDDSALKIGDSCQRFYGLGAFKSYFVNARLDFSYRGTRHSEVYEALLKHNPYLDGFFNEDWEKIAFREYDVVICFSDRENELLGILTERYASTEEEQPLNCRFFSFSDKVSMLPAGTKTVFPGYPALWAHVMKHEIAPYLYITPEEKAWGNHWLQENGLQEGEQLFILVDAASKRFKLLDITVYFELINYLLDIEGAKVLVYDERGVGKEEFYKAWLGEDKASRVIFARNLGLREAMYLIASDHTRLIIGPCTGLLHCASGIYNYFSHQGLPGEAMPLMITYTGKYEKPEDNAGVWWARSPLIHCLLLRQNPAARSSKEAVLLSELPEREKYDTSRSILCKEYTSAMLIEFIEKKLNIQSFII